VLIIAVKRLQSENHDVRFLRRIRRCLCAWLIIITCADEVTYLSRFGLLRLFADQFVSRITGRVVDDFS